MWCQIIEKYEQIYSSFQLEIFVCLAILESTVMYIFSESGKFSHLTTFQCCFSWFILGSLWLMTSKTCPWTSLGGTGGKNLPVSAGDTGLIPGPGNLTYLRTTKPMCHGCWPQAPGPSLSCSYWACVSKAQQQEKPEHHNRRVALTLHNWRKPVCSNWDSSHPKKLVKKDMS